MPGSSACYDCHLALLFLRNTIAAQIIFSVFNHIGVRRVNTVKHVIRILLGGIDYLFHSVLLRE